MAGKKYSKKKKVHRRRRRNRFHKNNKAVITRVKGMGIPDMLYVKLTYCSLDHVSSLNYYSEYYYRGNSIWDPDGTGSGHQPLYYDQYSLLYNKYRVIGSAITLDVMNDSGVKALMYVVQPSTDISPLTDITTVYEQQRSKAPKFVPIAQRVASRHKQYCSTRQVCGLTKSQLYDDTFAANITADPSNVWYWNILFTTSDQTTAVQYSYMIKIVYYVQFFDRKIVPQS